MATKPREMSETGFYHVMQRGVNLFDIFEDDDDRQFFVDTMVEAARTIGVEIHAWCLMSDHTHILLKAEYEALSAFMRQLGSIYAKYFNRRHARSGPLFEGRFNSVCVNDDNQALSVVRYVHRNPIHHHEGALCGTYPWSSYGEYLTKKPVTCTIDFLIELIGSVAEFKRFHESERDHERQLDLETIGRMADDEARDLANEALARAGYGVDISHVGTMTRNRRDEAIASVRLAVGCSLRQIQRLTSIAYSAIRSAVAMGLSYDSRVGDAPYERADAELARSLEAICLSRVAAM